MWCWPHQTGWILILYINHHHHQQLRGVRSQSKSLARVQRRMFCNRGSRHLHSPGSWCWWAIITIGEFCILLGSSIRLFSTGIVVIHKYFACSSSEDLAGGKAGLNKARRGHMKSIWPAPVPQSRMRAIQISAHYGMDPSDSHIGAIHPSVPATAYPKTKRLGTFRRVNIEASLERQTPLERLRATFVSQIQVSGHELGFKITSLKEL